MTFQPPNPAPRGSDYQIGACIERGNNLPGPAINRFFYAQNITGLLPKKTIERGANMIPNGRTAAGRPTRIDIATKWDVEPDVDSLAWRRAVQNGMYAIANPTTGVYEWTMHPRERGESSPTYCDSADFEITDGDGFPVLLTGMRMSDTEIKIVDGKIISITEQWLGCFYSYASRAVGTPATFTGKPVLIGSFGAGISQVKAKVTALAAGGADGSVKFTVNRPSSGTVTTNGTTALVGDAETTFTDYAVGDIVDITGETPKTIAAIADDHHLTLSAAAATSVAALAYVVSWGYGTAGTAIAVEFDRYTRVSRNPADATVVWRAGVDRNLDLFMLFPSGSGALAIGDEWTFLSVRTLATPSYSSRDSLISAAFDLNIDGFQYGGTPNEPGFRNATVKITSPKKPNFAGGLLSHASQRGDDPMMTIKLNRDREDRRLLEKMERFERMAILFNMYGNPIGTTGYDEFWGFNCPSVETSTLVRDVTTKTALPEDSDLTAVGLSGPIYTETIRCTVAAP